ncbi:hypothetical protein MCOR07_001990 [Pyricularia oryzae]|nr:hypothetical protein MCOR07_001990 [Pyricularia oryzae]
MPCHETGWGWGEYPCGSSLFLPDGTGTLRFGIKARNIPHLKPEWELLDDALRYHMLTLQEGRFTVRGYGGAVDVRPTRPWELAGG